MFKDGEKEQLVQSYLIKSLSVSQVKHMAFICRSDSRSSSKKDEIIGNSNLLGDFH